jgi:hypothetical protein
MALLPKVYAPTPAQSIASTRTVPSSRVASREGYVEEANAGLPASNLDNAPFTLQGEWQERSGHGQHRERPPARHAELLQVPSRAFGSLLEYYGNDSVEDAGPEVRARRIGGLIPHAIKTYETNAKIIHGEPDITGTEISLRL